MTDTKHTPTPWEISHDDGTMPGYVTRIIGSNGDIVADNEKYYPCPLDPDNAAHIVKCVNMHDELVAALENLAEVCEGSFAKPKEQDDLIEALRVLKKAGVQ